MCVAPIPLRQDNAKFGASKPFGLAKSDVINVPCGRCVECRRTHINGWVFRLTNELKSKTTSKAYFLTLTYDDDHLYNPDNGLITLDGEFQLNYTHHQLYMKRLRKSYGNGKSIIKYFTVGEYGDKSDRPHFHSIIFNADQQNILDSWTFGNVHFGDVTESSIAYTLKYAMKKIGRVHKSDWKNIQASRPEEKALISRGIGLSYLTDNVKKFYKNDLEKNLIKEGGVVQPLPRYYRQKIYSETELQARSRLVQKAMERTYSLEGERERQAVAKKKYSDEATKQKKRKNTGY